VSVCHLSRLSVCRCVCALACASSGNVRLLLRKWLSMSKWNWFDTIVLVWSLVSGVVALSGVHLSETLLDIVDAVRALRCVGSCL
jgi:hypothetical protein